MIGARLKAARERAGLTQTELANQMNTKQNTVWRWENETYIPDDDTKMKLARLLNVPIGYLMGEDISVNNDSPLDKMLSELMQEDPALVARFRSTGENWSRFSDEEKQALIDGFNFVLGRSISPRLKILGKDKRI